MGTKVKVAVRVRPMNKRELDLGTRCVVDMDGDQTILDSWSGKPLRTFAFDHCFWSMDPNDPRFHDQEHVFKSLGMDILDNAFEGYNACIFAYGQTGSGKSYSMMGASSGSEEEMRGVIPRLCDSLFLRIAKNDNPRITYKVEVSYMEIYCEKVRDLLCPKGGKNILKVREHKVLGPYVEHLSKLAVTTFKEISVLMSEGNKSRTVAATQMNSESSRSHAVFSIVLTQSRVAKKGVGTEKVSKLSLVDLAGSERVAKTGSVGDRLKEGSNINKSLSTLGQVISCLADISAGKKSRSSYVPYRDSTLTWLLKDNLGGNSKTVMVATVSPASDNYEETLSTLRYADRAKRIVNHAVVNEDANSRMIRELREEVEKLRMQLTGGGGGEGGGVSPKELLALQEKLQLSENLISDLSKTWEQKLAEATRAHLERQQALENMGISVQASGIGVQTDKFYLVNLNADPSLNELLVCYLKEMNRIGRPNTQPPQDIQLRGLGIANEHCIINIVEKDLFLTPMQGARTLINGRLITEKERVRHGARILLGNNHLFRLSCPGGVGQGAELMDYEQAMKEVAQQELKDDPMYMKMKDELIAKHEAEKEGALELQKRMYEEQLAKMKEQLVTTPMTTPPPPPSKPVFTTLEEEWEHRNKERLINHVLKANRLVREANMLADELHKDALFKVTVTVPRSFLSYHHQVDTEEMHTSNEVAIRVLHHQRGTDSVWSLDALEEKVLTMREMYGRIEEGGPLLDEELGPDPFYDLEQHALLGVANIMLECLHYGVVHEYDAPVVAPTGLVCGSLKMAVQRVPMALLMEDRDQDGEEVDFSGALELLENGGELRVGTQLACKVTILEATGLPKEYSHNVFCQYHFWLQEEAMIIPPLVQFGPEEPHDGVQTFDHSQIFTVDVSEEFLEYLAQGALSVEVWGHRRSGFNDNNFPGSEEGSNKRPKSFAERWNELTNRLELWVEVMELNEEGEYIPVEIQNKTDVLTGGIFMIRQGQSRRINVVVHPQEETGRLVFDSIKSVSVGSTYLRNRYDEPLDSYQEKDLERLRSKWSEALMNRRDYLDQEVRKVMDKREHSTADLERQNELLDQWAMLQWQRAAVMQPKAGSGVPGAPNNWRLLPGMEAHVPTLFMDLSTSVDTDDDVVETTTSGALFGEKQEAMIDLPIISREELQATASWDSTVHNTNSLNRQTASNDRVYAILRVTVKLKSPPGLELTLRKRICLRVYKRIGIGATLLRAITGRDTRTACGVMYEVVTGIPTSEGMQPPPKIPTNPSYVELDEDENAVEKFKTAMSSISSILTIDRLKQEVALREKLNKSGKVLKKRFSMTPAVGESPSLSRADSGIIYSGSRAESPEPEEKAVEETFQSGSPLMMATSHSPDEEEATTVGGGAVGLPIPTHLDIQNTEDPIDVQRSDAIPKDTGGWVEGGTSALEAIPEEEHTHEEKEEDGEKAGQGEVKGGEREEEESASLPAQETPVPEESPVLETGGDEREGEEEEGEKGGAVEPLPPHQGEGGEGGLQLSEIPEVITSSEEPQAPPLEGSEVKVVLQEEGEVVLDDVSQHRRRSEGDILEVKVPVKHKPPIPPHSRSTSSSPLLDRSKTGRRPASPGPGASKRELSPSRAAGLTREPSPTPSSEESETSSIVSDTPASKPSPPLPSKGEKVMVDLSVGFKMGIVMFVGETEFAPGEKVGVALDGAYGKNNGTVKGVKYFKCKEKHGVFVTANKIIRQPSGSPTVSKSRTKSPSPGLSHRRPTSNPTVFSTSHRPTYPSKSAYSRRTSSGGKRT